MTIPTIAEIRDQILSDIESGLNITTPLLPRSVFGILATAVAGVAVLIYRFAEFAQRQIFTQTADSRALELRGAEYGLTRNPATEWRGNATITGVNTTTVPAGTVWQKEGVAYEQTSTVAISGTTTIAIRSLETGAEKNRANGEELLIVAPLTGVDRTATITATTQTAVDPEPIEAFRARVLQRQQNLPQGGAFPDWIRWATEVPGIAEAFIERPIAGFVNIYPLTDDPNPANRIPSGAKLTEVQNYVSDQRRAPIRAANIDVLAATEIEFDVDISDLSPSNPTLQARIESAIETYMFARRPKQYPDEVDPVDIISAGEITRIAIESGAQVATVDLKTAGGTSITSQQLDPGELAKSRTVTFI